MSRKYDSRTTTFSPEGRLYQIEYAMEAISHAGLTLGIMATDGIVLVAVRRKTTGILEEPNQVTFACLLTCQSSMEKIFKLDNHLVVAIAGLTADANMLVSEARKRCLSHWKCFSNNIPCELLVQWVGNIKQAFTQKGGLRPFGVSLLYAGWDSILGFQLYHSDPSGNYAAWKATAVGAQSQAAQSYLKNEYTEELTVEQAKTLAFKTLHHILVGENDEENEEDEASAGEKLAETMETYETDVDETVATDPTTGNPVIQILSAEELKKEISHQVMMSVVS